MAIPIEGFTVVAKWDRIEPILEDHSFEVPNSRAVNDSHIWACSFMAETDALKFRKTLEERGLNTSQGPDSDVVLINEFDQSIDPYCEWLNSGKWEKAIIAWLEGTKPETVSAREGWDPNVGSGLTFQDPSSMDQLEFLRLEENIEVFLNKETGEEVYIGRTSPPIDSLYKTASEVVEKHFVEVGHPAVTGSVAEEVAEAASMLEKVLAERPDWCSAQWFYGKSQVALGNYEAAYESLKKAHQLEGSEEFIPRELAGVCLNLGRFDESVEFAEAALAIEPDNSDLLGNLAVAYLLAGRNDHAQKALDAAIKLNPEDKINQLISLRLTEIAEGSREQPKSLSELSKPAKPKKKRFFKWPWK